MHHRTAARLAPLLLATLLAATSALALPRVAGAQQWNDARALLLVRRATERRAQQLADTTLVDYRATAHGYLTFLAQLGEGFTEPPKVVKADELALEIFWKAPNHSRQRIVGRRDTLLLPTDINYHRDHLGIVQNNFPDIIRLGDGDEVLDVPHPLSAAGLAAYDYSVGDSLRVRLPGRTVTVYAVRVRPRDDRQPRAVGAVFIDTAEAQVVRMAFSFTRAALRDQQLEDVSIVLENALIEGRYWLPLRQEIEIRRAGTFLEYPARGIIRGRWEVCCYQTNTGLPAALFADGQEIVQAPARTLREHQWETPRLLDELPPDVRAVTDEEVRVVQEEARALVRAQALARARRPTLAARRASDFVRVNRVEGLAVGAGVARQLGGGWLVAGNGRWGLDDEAFKGRLSLEWRSATAGAVRLTWLRDFRDVSAEQETSLLRNSIAAQESGSDYTQPYAVHGWEISVEGNVPRGLRLRATVSSERQDSLRVHASPSSGSYEPTIPATPLGAIRVALRLARPTSLFLGGTELQGHVELRGLAYGETTDARCRIDPATCDIFEADASQVVHANAAYRLERPFGRHRLVLHGVAGGVSGSAIPAQELVYLGGPTTGPGYRFHQFVGRGGASQRVEWQLPVPFVGVPLGRFGRAPAQAALAPFVQGIWLRRGDESGADQAIGAGRAGFSPSVGLGVLTFFELLRVDVARGLRDGRWTASVDVSRDFWPVL
jgi:hypothetical protein